MRIHFWLLFFTCLALQETMGQPDLPKGFVPEVVFAGIDGISMAFAPGNRMFVTEKKGNVYLIQDGSPITEPILSIPVDDRQERGLLGIAIDPEFEYNN